MIGGGGGGGVGVGVEDVEDSLMGGRGRSVVVGKTEISGRGLNEWREEVG